MCIGYAPSNVHVLYTSSSEHPHTYIHTRLWMNWTAYHTSNKHHVSMCVFTVYSMYLDEFCHPLQCLDLHKTLHSSRVVVLTGPGCSGKSTVCTLLAAAYRQLRTEGGGMGYPRVKMTTIHPAQHTVEEVRMHVRMHLHTYVFVYLC